MMDQHYVWLLALLAVVVAATWVLHVASTMGAL